MGERWVLNRAGILNVYQYTDEVLSFGGGRLLLRGVNGSGKSTAMNMLLPFLLDGDTRKIDAAGEQSGVLKSWMLSGRDDAQPIGYLWIEFAKGGEYLTCGCGIRANRASDTVSTWWWVTPRRPSIDLDLVTDNRPLNAEGLRAVIGAEAVWRHEDRRGYREEVRRRLFGGADIDQHIRLLHVVRSPRVGDRIDQDLPSYLHDALPQLSEAALSDAAQPLDDLDEHRRNVAELSRTATALTALHDVYADYCRSELRRRAAWARELAELADRSRRATARAETDRREAQAAMAAATDQVQALEVHQGQTRIEIEALRDSPAYKEGAQLADLRDHVKSQHQAAEAASRELDRRRRDEEARRQDAVNAARAARLDHTEMEAGLREVGGSVGQAGLTEPAPDLPPLRTRVVDGQSSVEEPAPLPVEEIRGRLARVRAAAQLRRGDVDAVRHELRVVGQAAARLEAAGRDLEVAEAEVGERRAALADRTSGLDRAVAQWRESLRTWIGDLSSRSVAAGLVPAQGIDLQARLADRRAEVRLALQSEADRLVAHHERVVAAGEASVQRLQGEVDEAVSAVAALDAVSLPDPPAQPWQRSDRGPTLAELVDYTDGVDDVTRAAIEAGLEAGGLLTAEVTSDGSIRLEPGTLLGVPDQEVPQPLSRYLCAIPGAFDVVNRLLDSISTDPADLDLPGATVVTIDGRFRIGSLAGRHVKPQAEHVGLTARKERLERLRSEARHGLEEVRRTLFVRQTELADAVTGRDEAVALRHGLPTDEPVGSALVALQHASDTAARAEARLAERAESQRLADSAHADAVDNSRRIANNLGLIPDEAELDAVGAAITAIVTAVTGAEHAVKALLRSLDGWAAAVDRWTTSRKLLSAGQEDADESQAELERLTRRLDLLDQQFGAAYKEISAGIDAREEDLKKTDEDLHRWRQAVLAANTELATASKEVETRSQAAADAEQKAVGAIPQLRRALAVPGLVASLGGDTPWAAEPVEETVGGLRHLVDAIRSRVGEGGREVSGDGVRQSLRQRRDSLGAGWDAEDRQPDETLPLTVEINGPEGRLPLADAVTVVQARRSELTALLSSEQDSALRNLLQGLVAQEVAEKLHEAEDLIKRMNSRLDSISTAHGIGVSIRWRRRDDLDPERSTLVALLAKRPDIRTEEEDARLRQALSTQLDYARRDDPEAPYRDLIGRLLEYRSWYGITLMLRRPGRDPERLSRRTPLSEGEKKIVSYLPLFAAVAASCDSLAEGAPFAPRFLLLDDAFAKVSEDNHPKLFGLLVELDLDFIATSERLWGTYATVPELAITEVIRDAALGVVVLEHSHWDGSSKEPVP